MIFELGIYIIVGSLVLGSICLGMMKFEKAEENKRRVKARRKVVTSKEVGTMYNIIVQDYDKNNIA